MLIAWQMTSWISCPYVDQLVCGIIKQGVDYAELTRELKAQLLTIPVLETYMSGKRSPLMVAVGANYGFSV